MLSARQAVECALAHVQELIQDQRSKDVLVEEIWTGKEKGGRQVWKITVSLPAAPLPFVAGVLGQARDRAFKTVVVEGHDGSLIAMKERIVESA